MQQWIKANHDPSKGFGNYSNYKNQNYCARVSNNAIRMRPNNKQLINSAPIGKTAYMSEIISIKLKDDESYTPTQSKNTV